MTIASDLRRVRDLLSDPARWTQGAFARDKDGNVADWRKAEAVCFSLVGAGCHEKVSDAAWDALVDARTSLYPNQLFSDVNDTLGHAAVLRVLDLAIERAGE